MNKLLISVVTFVLMLPLSSQAQNVFTIDSCRQLALEHNKQLQTARLKKDVATLTRKAARTQYLPKVDAMGAYEYTNREISLLNNQQKTALATLGTSFTNSIGERAESLIRQQVAAGLMSPEEAQRLSNRIGQLGEAAATIGDQAGQRIVDAFRTDTRNLFAASVMVRQPIFMGGAITAANKMADLAELIANDENDLAEQDVIYNVEQTYWLTVSLSQKRQLAEDYLQLVKKFDQDVHHMIQQGVATRADGLKVDVRVNEADMALTKAENGYSLAKMLLMQECGLPLDTQVKLMEDVSPSKTSQRDIDTLAIRPELRMLEKAVALSKANTQLVRSAFLPHIALTAGYMASNPNLFNGFQRRFSGTWNVGVLVQVPIWNWKEGIYKVRAAQKAAAMAETQYQDAQEKIDLQVEQSRYRLNEAQKQLVMAQKNMASAEENLRCANVGFREGVMESTEVMAAQTAWQAAHTQRIDAEIGLRMAQLNLSKALGNLKY